MTSDEPDALPSLGELLGIDVLAELPDPPDQVWAQMLDIATDPHTPAVDSALIPVDTLDEIDLETVTVDPLDSDSDPTALDVGQAEPTAAVTDADAAHEDYSEAEDGSMTEEPFAGVDDPELGL